MASLHAKFMASSNMKQSCYLKPSPVLFSHPFTTLHSIINDMSLQHISSSLYVLQINRQSLYIIYFVYFEQKHYISSMSDCPLMQLARDPKALKEKVAVLWAELSKDEPENQQRPANLEQLTVMVTRELARRVVHLVNYSREGITMLPQTISHSLHLAADYCAQLTDVVVKVPIQCIPCRLKMR